MPTEQRRRITAMMMTGELLARFASYERLNSDAYSWHQEAVFDPEEETVLEWWFERSTRLVGSTLGSSYSEGALFKFVALSKVLAFMSVVPKHELVSFLRLAPVSSLREDLALSRCELARSPDVGFREAVIRTGEFVKFRLRDFERSLADRGKSARGNMINEGVKLGGAAAFSVLSSICPPLSAVSLLWGGSVSDLVKNVSGERRQLMAEVRRPIMTLVKWRRQAVGPELPKILDI
jgi:hypothetical protein